MKHQGRLTVERLEDRWCPALTVALNAGTLSISGAADNGSIHVVQDSTTAGTINVLDGTTAVSGSPFTNVSNVVLKLTSADDNVTINLGGQTLPGFVNAHLGDGANTLTVENGAVGTWFAVGAGSGKDTVTLGDGTAKLSLKYALVWLDGDVDTLTVASGATISGALGGFGMNTVNLNAGSTVNETYLGIGTLGGTVTAAGSVTGNLVVDAFHWWGSSAGTTVTATGSVAGYLVFLGSTQNDSLTVSGTVGKGLGALTFGGDDSITVSGNVTGLMGLDTGAGNDSIALSGTVGDRTFIDTGAGADVLTMGPTAKFQNAAYINMGPGNDSVTLDDAASITTMFINGGFGTNTFTGTKTRTGLTLFGF
jgi:hypothetical protein